MDARIQTLISEAKHAGAKQVIVEMVTIVFAEEHTHSAEERPSAAEFDHEPESEIDLAASEQRALRFSEWAAILPSIAANELERAVKATAIVANRKGHGPDHNALVIDSEGMTEYVRLCSQVQAGESTPPEWWSTVRKGNNVIIRNERDGSRGAGSPPRRKVA